MKMRTYFINNLKKITALLLAASMTMTMNISAFAQEVMVQEDAVDTVHDDSVQDDSVHEEAITAEESLHDETEAEITNAFMEKASLAEEDSGEADYPIYKDYETDEQARQAECMPGSPYYLMKFLTYLSLKYPDIGIKPQYGGGNNPGIDGHDFYNAKRMAEQELYDTIIIDGNDTFPEVPDLTKNMVQFRFLSNFDGDIGAGVDQYNRTVKTLIIRNVDEIRNLSVPASVENLIIENTTLNCYFFENDSPVFQTSYSGSLEKCTNLKKLVLNNVKFGDNYKNSELKDYDWGSCGYETNYVLNLRECYDLEELVINVSFDGAEEVQLAIDGGTQNLFQNLSDETCTISPTPGTGLGQVILYANDNSYLAKRYSAFKTVKFKNEPFRTWLMKALGVDTNHDGVISQGELNAVDTLMINDRTARSIPGFSLSDFADLTDICQMHGLKTLELDYYDPSSSYMAKDNRQALKAIDFPDSLLNLSMSNVYWVKDTETKSQENADIILTNLRKLELYNTVVEVKKSDDSYFSHPTQIVLTDTDGVLNTVKIEGADVESVQLINNSNGAGIIPGDDRKRIHFSASDCPNLTSIEFLGEGYAIEGSLDLSNDNKLTHIGVPNADNTEWTVYGEFDMTGAPVNVTLNSCSSLGSDCKKIIINYHFLGGKSLNVQTMNTNWDDGHQLTIYRYVKTEEETAGDVYLSCDKAGWVYRHYQTMDGFVIEDRSSFPTIAVFAAGQQIRTAAEGSHNSDLYTEDTDLWLERKNLVLAPGGYANNFANLTFYVVDNGSSLRKVFYKGDVYVEWEQQEEADPIITLPTEQDATGGYKLTGTKLTSTGTPGEVLLNLYVLTEGGDKSYIGYQQIKIYKMPTSVELVNDGTVRGSGTKDDPYIVNKNEELRLKARLLVDEGIVDNSGDHALRDIYWRIKEYDETPKYTSDSDGYSLYTLDTATKAGISVVRDKLNYGETETAYDKKVDDRTYYNHRRFLFDTAGSKFKIVAQSPYKNNDVVINTEVFVEFRNESFWCTNIEDQIYTGKAIKPQLGIYYGGIRLVEGKDYTLAYGNNVKAAPKTAVNNKGGRIGPSVTITGKGNYSGKQVYYFTILPRSIESTAKVGDLIVAETKRSIAIKPVVVLDGKALKQGTDYVVSTSMDEKDAIVSLTDPGEYPLYVVGRGNYEGAVPFQFHITESVLASKAGFSKIANQNYQSGVAVGPSIKESIKLTYAKKDVTDCFDITFDHDTEVGTATVIATAKKGVVGAAGYSFAGVKTTTFKILGLNIKDARLGENGKGKLPEYTYSGSACEPKPSLYDKTGTVPLVEGTDYSITYLNNTNAGTATVVIDGKGQYTGTKKITFKINKYDAGTDSEKSIKVDNGEDISEPYAKGGAMPKRDVTRNGVLLIENKDYKLSYANNNAVVSSPKVPQIIVKFIGNYSGTKIVPFTIHAQDIDECTITLADKTVSTNANAWKQTAATIVDLNNKKLAAGKDYSTAFEYFYDSACFCPIEDTTIPANTTIYVKISGINNYAGSEIVGTYRVSMTNISSAKAAIDNQVFTGKEICPTADQITVTTGTKKNPKPPLTPGVDYEIVPDSYQKNISKGIATVTIRGKGEYFGTKVVKFNIVVNKISWWIW